MILINNLYWGLTLSISHSLPRLTHPVNNCSLSRDTVTPLPLTCEGNPLPLTGNMAHTDTLLFISLHSVMDTDELGVYYKATGKAIKVSGNLIQDVYVIQSRWGDRRANATVAVSKFVVSKKPQQPGVYGVGF